MNDNMQMERKDNCYWVNVFVQCGSNGENYRFNPRVVVKMGGIPSLGDHIHLDRKSVESLNQSIRNHNRLFDDNMATLDFDCFKVVKRLYPESGFYGKIDANIYVGYGEKI